MVGIAVVSRTYGILEPPCATGDPDQNRTKAVTPTVGVGGGSRKVTARDSSERPPVQTTENEKPPVAPPAPRAEHGLRQVPASTARTGVSAVQIAAGHGTGGAAGLPEALNSVQRWGCLRREPGARQARSAPGAYAD